MSLQGTLDTFSLPEILDLVEKSRKTGALEVRDPQSRGVLYFAGGRFSAAEAGDLNGPVESADELEARLIDVCFALFRVETGLFEFENDRFPPWPVRGGSEVAPVVEQVQQLRRDWLAIEAVLPSLDCRPDAVDDLDGDRVVLNKAGFRVLRHVDGDRNVREIARAVGRSVLEVCKVLKDLIDAGAVVVPSAPNRTVVDELVLPADTVPVDAAPAESYVASSGAAGAGLADAHVDLPEVPGLVVPSSPEGLTEAEYRILEDDLAGVAAPPPEPTAPEPVEPEPVEAYVEPEPAPRPVVEPEPVAEVAYADPVPEPVVDAGYDTAVPAPEPVHEAPDEPFVEAAIDPEPQTGAGPEPQPAPPPEPVAEDDDEPAPDRGALLRMFSSLRDA